jgi:hypothetical protein
VRVDAKRLAEIQARVDAASPGPWFHDGTEETMVYRGEPGWHPIFASTKSGTGFYGVALFRGLGRNGGSGFDRETGGANCRFSANARTDVHDLLTDLREARQLAENLEIRLMETERARLLAVERAERAEASTFGLRGEQSHPAHPAVEP